MNCTADATDWVRSDADERFVAAGGRFDLAAAERVRQFFRQFLRHSKGEWAGLPFELLPWQWRDIVAPLFGWKRADGTRRYRRGHLEVPKKNGKSTLFSGLSLYLLAGDGEPGAEIYSAAVDRDQASIVYGEAANMVEASPELSSRLNVIRSTRRIVFHRNRSVCRALSADVPAKAGPTRKSGGKRTPVSASPSPQNSSLRTAAKRRNRRPRRTVSADIG